MASIRTSILLDSRGAPWIAGPGWVEVDGDQFVGGSSAWAFQNDSTSLALNFTGIGISLLGNTVELVPWNFTSSLDGETPAYHAMTQEGFEQLTYDWYNVSGLPEGQHTLNLTAISRGLALDYAAIEPSQSQNVRDQILIVDDSSSLIKYTGDWVESSSDYLRVNKRPVTPHGGGSHVSTTIGDVLQFPFTGTEVRVYGFYDWRVTGELEIAYTIDDGPAEKRIYPLNGTEPHDFQFQPNYVYYDALSTPGDHILTINVTRIVGGQKVIIDAIHYRAAFDNMASMPQIIIPALPKASSDPSPSPSTTNKKPTNVGAIAGGVIGGVVAILIIIALLILLLRRVRAGKPNDADIDNETQGPQMVIEPFTLPMSYALVAESGPTRPKLDGPKQSTVTTTGRESPLSSTSGLGIAHSPDSRVEQLERQVQQLARETAQLQNAQMPPPYQ